MRIVRYRDNEGAVRHAAHVGSGALRRIEGDIFGDFRVRGDAADVAKLLAPLEPVAIICIGLNYRKHAAESGLGPPEYPVVFVKNPASVQNPGDAIEIPMFLASDSVDYEGELCVVIGKRCKNVTEDDALDYVLGYTCGNDVSARDWQRQKGGSQWCRGKSFDTFAPLGPCIALKDEIPDPNKLRLRTIVSGEVMQDWGTDDMIFSVRSLIAFLSGSTTLLPGTVIMTGTPHGVGMGKNPPRWLHPGDTVSVEIEGIGTLTNPVVNEP
jgi:2-keto-4-pentenoate hydratase/2-oxohepta-3-ene-1,7-dioic acid hydratase in catechol pathway